MITAEEYTNLPVFTPDASFKYGSEPLQTADLYLPADAPSHPVIVMVHGGCYREQYGAAPLGGICRALTESGFAVWNLDYRRNGNGGGYPQTMLDVANGADFLRTIAADYKLDLTRVTGMGHSAGGHLVVWLAARHRLPETSALYIANPLKINSVVCLAGIVDVAFGVKQGQCGDSLPMIMGGTPDEVPEHYRDASPMALIPIGVRQIHIIGEADTQMIDNTRPFVEASKAAGDEVTLNIVPEADHFEIVVPTTKAWPAVVEAAVALRGN